MATATDGKTAKQRIDDSMKKLNDTITKRKAALRSTAIQNKGTAGVVHVRKPFTFEYHDGKNIDPSKAI